MIQKLKLRWLEVLISPKTKYGHTHISAPKNGKPMSKTDASTPV